MEILLSERTKRNAMERIRKLTPRQWGGKLESCIAQLNAWLRGWHQFFGISSASEQSRLRALDAHIRGVGYARSCCAIGRPTNNRTPVIHGL